MATFPTETELRVSAAYDRAQDLTGTGLYAEVGSAAQRAPLEKEARSAYQEIGRELFEENIYGRTETADEQGRVFMGYEYDTPEGVDMQGYSLRQVGGIWYLYDPNGVEVAKSGQAEGVKRILEAVKDPNRSLLGGARPSADVISAIETMQQDPTDLRKPIYQTGYQPGEEVLVSKGMIDIMGPSKAKTVDPETGEITYNRAGYDAEGNRLSVADAGQQIKQTYEEQQAYADLDLGEKAATRITDITRGIGDIGEKLEDIGKVTESNQELISGAQRQYLNQASGLFGQGMTEDQLNKARQEMRAREQASGGLRDFGAGVREVEHVLREDAKWQAFNEKRAMDLIGSASEMGTEAQRQAIANLAAEIRTAGDPKDWIHTAHGGAATNMVSGKEFSQETMYQDPASSIDFNYNRNMDINQDKMESQAMWMGLAGSTIDAGSDIASSYLTGKG